jgi:hypothetical protein
MTPRLHLTLLCLVLACGGLACASKLAGPTVPSGYFFALQVSESTIWLGPADAGMAARFPSSSELIVRVQNAQGQPVDGIPVVFEVEPGWMQQASVSPPHVMTDHGIARATFQAQTRGWS